MARKYRTTEVRQHQIVAAMRKLIFKYGSENVTVRGIAKEVGFSEAAIYRHFTSKKMIYSFLAGYIGELLLSYAAEGVKTNTSTINRLNIVLKSTVSAAEQKQGMSFHVIAEIISLGDKKLNEKVQGDLEKYLMEIRNLIVDGIQKGEIREDIDPETMALMLFGNIQGIVNLWILSNCRFNLLDRYESVWSMNRTLLAKAK